MNKRLLFILILGLAVLTIFLNACTQQPVCGDSICQTGEDQKTINGQDNPLYCADDCQNIECTSNEDCSANEKCENNECVILSNQNPQPVPNGNLVADLKLTPTPPSFDTELTFDASGSLGNIVDYVIMLRNEDNPNMVSEMICNVHCTKNDSGDFTCTRIPNFGSWADNCSAGDRQLKVTIPSQSNVLWSVRNIVTDSEGNTSKYLIWFNLKENKIVNEKLDGEPV